MTISQAKKRLLESLVGNGFLKEGGRPYYAMQQVDRINFVSRGDHAVAYDDCPQPIGYHATISAPHMHAFALEHFGEHAKENARVLDVGVGSGYLLAAFAEMCGKQGLFVGIENIPELVNLARDNLTPQYNDMLEDGRMKVLKADGWKGVPEHAPYDIIHVGAAATEVPKALLDQLAIGGRMVIPVGGVLGENMYIIDKQPDGSFKKQVSISVRYVPLVKYSD
eukprot:Clim_evm112s172 gene=Clim_evmTU112s172